MGRLQGKSVIITGAGSGIGRAAALLFTQEGAKLIAVDRTEAVKETVDEIEVRRWRRGSHGGRCGLRARTSSRVIDKAVKTHGRLDVIWANAGVSGGLVPLAEQTVEHWQEVLRINLIGPFLAVKYAMPHMVKQQSGAIVLTASVAGLRAGASGHPYAASKAGVISLVQTTAYSLAGTGVRINAVCPGLIETGMTKQIFDRAKERGTQDKIGQLNPLKRPGQPRRARRDGTVFGERRGVVCERPGLPGRTAVHCVDAVYGQAGVIRVGVPDALQRSRRCGAEPGPKPQDWPRHEIGVWPMLFQNRHCERSEAIKNLSAVHRLKIASLRSSMT